MYGCESWTVKKAVHRRPDASELWCWRRLLRVPWTARRSNQSILKKIKPINLRGNQPWIFIGRTDAEVEAPILWPPDAKNWLIGKDPDAGKDSSQKEKGTTQDEMVHHRLNGHEFEQALGVGDGQERLACCCPWGRKESDMTDWTELRAESERSWNPRTSMSSYVNTNFLLLLQFLWVGISKPHIFLKVKKTQLNTQGLHRWKIA